MNLPEYVTPGSSLLYKEINVAHGMKWMDGKAEADILIFSGPHVTIHQSSFTCSKVIVKDGPVTFLNCRFDFHTAGDVGTVFEGEDFTLDQCSLQFQPGTYHLTSTEESFTVVGEGGTPGGGNSPEVVKWAHRLKGEHPACCPVNPDCHTLRDYTGFITHLNDAHRWTFDEIADFIEQNGYDIVVSNREEGGAA